MGLEHIIFYSDAVITITLLALEILLPESVTSPADLGHQIWLVKPHYMSFIISFFVIGLCWMSHHRVIEKFKTYDSDVTWINRVILLLIAFVPLPTSVLGHFPADFASVIPYASRLVCLSLVDIGF